MCTRAIAVVEAILTVGILAGARRAIDKVHHSYAYVSFEVAQRLGVSNL